MAASLKEVEAMVDELNPQDQARLLAYLAPRIVEAVGKSKAGNGNAERAWEVFQRVGEQVAAAPSSGSMVQAISDMRR